MLLKMWMHLSHTQDLQAGHIYILDFMRDIHFCISGFGLMSYLMRPPQSLCLSWFQYSWKGQHCYTTFLDIKKTSKSHYTFCNFLWIRGVVKLKTKTCNCIIEYLCCRVLSENLLHLLKKHPETLLDQASEIKDFLISPRNISGRKEFFANLVSCWWFGFWFFNTHAILNWMNPNINQIMYIFIWMSCLDILVNIYFN